MRRRRFQELRRILKSAEMSEVIRGASDSTSSVKAEPSTGAGTVSKVRSHATPRLGPYFPQVRPVGGDAVLARSNRLTGRKRVTVGCDCCGLGSVWIALLALFAGSLGAQPELAFVSDSNQAVRRYVREQYQPKHVYTDVRERVNDDPDVPRVDIYALGFPCQPFSTADSQKGFEDGRSSVCFLLCGLHTGEAPGHFSSRKCHRTPYSRPRDVVCKGFGGVRFYWRRCQGRWRLAFRL